MDSEEIVDAVVGLISIAVIVVPPYVPFAVMLYDSSWTVAQTMVVGVLYGVVCILLPLLGFMLWMLGAVTIVLSVLLYGWMALGALP